MTSENKQGSPLVDAAEEQQVKVDDGRVVEYQVNLLVTFVLE